MQQARFESRLTLFVIKVTVKILSQISCDDTVTYLQLEGYKIVRKMKKDFQDPFLTISPTNR